MKRTAIINNGNKNVILGGDASNGWILRPGERIDYVGTPEMMYPVKYKFCLLLKRLGFINGDVPWDSLTIMEWG